MRRLCWPHMLGLTAPARQRPDSPGLYWLPLPTSGTVGSHGPSAAAWPGLAKPQKPYCIRQPGLLQPTLQSTTASGAADNPARCVAFNSTGFSKIPSPYHNDSGFYCLFDWRSSTSSFSRRCLSFSRSCLSSSASSFLYLRRNGSNVVSALLRCSVCISRSVSCWHSSCACFASLMSSSTLRMRGCTLAVLPCAWYRACLTQLAANQAYIACLNPSTLPCTLCRTGS